MMGVMGEYNLIGDGVYDENIMESPGNGGVPHSSFLSEEFFNLFTLLHMPPPSPISSGTQVCFEINATVRGFIVCPSIYSNVLS